MQRIIIDVNLGTLTCHIVKPIHWHQVVVKYSVCYRVPSKENRQLCSENLNFSMAFREGFYFFLFLFFCRAVQHAVSLFLNQGLNLGYGSEVKNLSVMQETRFWSLGREDTLEKEMATHPSILAWRIPMVRGAWWITVHGVAKSQTRLNSWHTYDTESAES